jgi:hypothetical protein
MVSLAGVVLLVIHFVYFPFFSGHVLMELHPGSEGMENLTDVPGGDLFATNIHLTSNSPKLLALTFPASEMPVALISKNWKWTISPKFSPQIMEQRDDLRFAYPTVKRPYLGKTKRGTPKPLEFSLPGYALAQQGVYDLIPEKKYFLILPVSDSIGNEDYQVTLRGAVSESPPLLFLYGLAAIFSGIGIVLLILRKYPNGPAPRVA